MSNGYTQLDQMTLGTFVAQGRFATAYRAFASELTYGSMEHKWFSYASHINAGVGLASTFA